MPQERRNPMMTDEQVRWANILHRTNECGLMPDEQEIAESVIIAQAMLEIEETILYAERAIATLREAAE
jgi:precorrin isomerase